MGSRAVRWLAPIWLAPIWLAISCLSAAAVVQGHPPEIKAQGYLGIEFHDVIQTAPGVFRFRSARQVEVGMVDHDGPAGKAGLRAHDLIQMWNGQPVTSSEALRQMIHDAGAGTSVTLEVVRDGRSRTLVTQLESREDVERRAWARVAPAASQPLPDEVESADTRNSPPVPSASLPLKSKHFLSEVLHGHSVGVQLQALTAQLALYFGAPPNGGLLVESVANGSPAAAAGLAAGDIILRADSNSLRTISDWNKQLHVSKGRPMSLVVLREHHEVRLNLDADPGRSMLEWPFERSFLFPPHGR